MEVVYVYFITGRCSTYIYVWKKAKMLKNVLSTELLGHCTCTFVHMHVYMCVQNGQEVLSGQYAKVQN